MQLFKSQRYQSILDKQGYVVIDFLSVTQAEVLNAFLLNQPPKIESVFYTTYFSDNRDYKRKVNDLILKTIAESFKDVFTESYRPILGNYMIKEAKGAIAMPLHADWTYVDENSSSSYAIWFPLLETNPENGCLGVIPFSQHITNNIRGPRILQWEYPANDILINNMGKILPMKVGQAVVYNHRLLHYSVANNSSIRRPAVNVSVVPTNCPLIHYAMPEGESQIIQFEVNDDDFYIEYDNFQMPDRGVIAQYHHLLSSPLFDSKVDDFIHRYGTNAQSGIISLIKQVFNRISARG